MNLVPITTCIALLVLCILSCDHHEGHHDHSDHGDSHSHSSQQHASSHDTHASSTENLRLNGDDKWQMDGHTRKMFAEMTARFQDINHSSLSQSQLKILGADLEKDLEKLIAGCTMEGEAHEELHKYLTAYMPTVQQLAMEGAPEQADDIVSLLALFSNYFE